jgi:cation diffusion facilitator CzcD-associated flavoprotein CzcO
MAQAPGCKRFIVDRGYLDSLNQPNVSIKWDTIERIEEFGIRLKTGELIALDVIIFATGFKMVKFLQSNEAALLMCLYPGLFAAKCHG